MPFRSSLLAAIPAALATLAAALPPGAALAGETVPRRAKAAKPAPEPAFSWTGAYLGVNGGYASGGERDALARRRDLPSRADVLDGRFPPAGR